jgi:hypothetical protein
MVAREAALKFRREQTLNTRKKKAFACFSKFKM